MTDMQETLPALYTSLCRRSLKAVYFLQQAGFQRVSHVSGGLAEWVREGLPLVEAGEDNDDEGSGSETARELVGALSFLGRR